MRCAYVRYFNLCPESLDAKTGQFRRERVLSTRYERWLKQLVFLFVFEAQKIEYLKKHKFSFFYFSLLYIYVGDERILEPSLRNFGKTPSIVI